MDGEKIVTCIAFSDTRDQLMIMHITILVIGVDWVIPSPSFGIMG